MNQPLSLRSHLDAIGKATGLRVGETADSIANVPELCALRTALAEDPELRDCAVTELQAIDPRVLMRDHISRWRKAVLESALKDVSHE